jgi:hypothetical protein
VQQRGFRWSRRSTVAPPVQHYVLQCGQHCLSRVRGHHFPLLLLSFTGSVQHKALH